MANSTIDGPGRSATRLSAIAALSVTLLLLACTPDSAPDAAATSTALGDCTFDEIAQRERHGGSMAATKAAELTDADRAAVLSVASEWARANCYLPCDFSMCGALIDLGPDAVGVYIRPLEPIEGGIYPEAGVEIDLASMTITASELLHTGCQYWTGNCVPEEMRKRESNAAARDVVTGRPPSHSAPE